MSPESSEVSDVEVQVLDQEHAGKAATAALVAEMCATVLTVVAESAKANRPRPNIVARDRVLVPEIRVGDVLEVVETLRPRLLGAAAGICGAGASRLTAAQSAIRSSIEKQS